MEEKIIYVANQLRSRGVDRHEICNCLKSPLCNVLTCAKLTKGSYDNLDETQPLFVEFCAKLIELHWHKIDTSHLCVKIS